MAYLEPYITAGDGARWKRTCLACVKPQLGPVPSTYKPKVKTAHQGDGYVKCLPSMCEILGSVPGSHKASMVVPHLGGGSMKVREVQGHLCLCSKFEASLGNIRLCL